MPSPHKLPRFAALLLAGLLLTFTFAFAGAASADEPANDASSAPTAASAASEPVPDLTFEHSSEGVVMVSDTGAESAGRGCFGRRATIVGTPHNDRIFGTSAQDVIVGLGGDDTISSGESNDFICGGNGRDKMYGRGDNDMITGQKGQDVLLGGLGADRITGLGSDDSITGEAGTDMLFGGSGNDTVYGGFSSDSDADGSGGLGQDSDDSLNGGPGNDALLGGDLDDTMRGNTGNDTMEGDGSTSVTTPVVDGNDTMIGGPGRDRFTGGAGNDTAQGGTDDDFFDGGLDADTLYGDGGIDAINGGEGIDHLLGGDQEDVLNGGGGGDTISGGAASDTLCGGPDVDTMMGGTDNDFLSGSADNCTFSVANLLNNFSEDQDVFNQLDGGPGNADLCVSPSTALSPQTINCEFTGFIRMDVVVEGNGTVTGGPTGGGLGSLNEFPIDCTNPSSGSGNVCSMFFLPSEVPISITLTADPANGWAFDGWSGVPGGACPGVTNPCTFTLDGSRTITATFVRQDTLTLNVSGPGSVTASPGGGMGVCNAGNSPCTATYTTGTSVTLTASSPTTWTGNPAPGCGVGVTCAFTMSGNRSVTAATT